MDHVKIIISSIDQADTDILVALLSEMGYDGFEEINGCLLAYIGRESFDESLVEALRETHNFSYTIEVVPAQNWNALWESNFQPVIIDGFCTVRAHFHDIEVNTPYDIIITPKMSFGTGHHATTVLMMQAMKNLDLKDKEIIDFGSGTGILAILAEMLGAASIKAIDNDEWCTENALENVVRNNCHKISVQTGSLELVQDNRVDVILANINRHILVHYLPMMHQVIKDDGLLLMSGLLVDDREIMVKAGIEAGFEFVSGSEHNGWIALQFKKTVFH